MWKRRCAPGRSGSRRRGRSGSSASRSRYRPAGRVATGRPAGGDPDHAAVFIKLLPVAIFDLCGKLRQTFLFQYDEGLVCGRGESKFVSGSGKRRADPACSIDRVQAALKVKVVCKERIKHEAGHEALGKERAALLGDGEEVWDTWSKSSQRVMEFGTNVSMIKDPFTWLYPFMQEYDEY